MALHVDASPDPLSRHDGHAVPANHARNSFVSARINSISCYADWA